MPSVFKYNGNEIIDSSGKLTASAFPSGSIVQVQSTQLTTNESTTLGSRGVNYVLMAGTANGSGSGLLDVDITPKITGSKIWLQCDWTGEFANSGNVHNHMFFFWRDTTKLGNTHSTLSTAITGVSPATLTYHGGDDDSTIEDLSMQYIDAHGISAGTQITYKVGIVLNAAGDTLFTNRTVADSDTADYERGVSSLVAIEIAP